MKTEMLYNKILIKSRNSELFKKNKINDNLQNKIIIFLLLFSLVFNKIKNFNKENNQKIFDYIFYKIELDLREAGFGDMLANQKMKVIVNKFYSILIDFDNFLNKSSQIKKKLVNKLFNSSENQDLNYNNLLKFLEKFAKMIDLKSADDIYCANF